MRSKKAKPVLKSFLPSAKSSTGFTLIELLIVIAIISILISIGMASFSRAQKQARDGGRKADIESIRGALEQYYADNNEYPGSLGDLDPKYMRVVPQDGTTDFNYDVTNSPYSTQYYCIGTDLETGTGTSVTCDGDSLNYVRTARD